MNFTAEFTSNHTGQYKNHGVWAKVVYPTNRSLQGSTLTPYIFDDRCDFNDVAKQMKAWYDISKEDRDAVGLKGREWLRSEESGMSAKEMSNRMASAITKLLGTWTPKETFEIFKVTDREKVSTPGIVWS